MLQIKRVFDVVFGLLGIVILSPVWFLTGVFIKASVRGRVIFTQTRIGYKGQKFQILKFRTMHDEDGTDGIARQMPRCGQVIRRLKLDELPQLINILKGEMSFVGPRPYIERECTGLPAERYEMRPGLTGLAQVNGNAELDWEERTAYDLEYIRSFTLWKDIRIIFRTIRVIILGEQACVRHIGTKADGM